MDNNNDLYRRTARAACPAASYVAITACEQLLAPAERGCLFLFRTLLQSAGAS